MDKQERIDIQNTIETTAIALRDVEPERQMAYVARLLDALRITDIQDTMDAAAAALLATEPRQRAGWIIYLIAILDDGRYDAEFSDTLVSVFMALSRRLTDQGWEERYNERQS